MNCKLVTRRMKTQAGEENETVWKVGTPIMAHNQNASLKLCSNSAVHYYSSPLLASFFNPVHANIQNPRAFVCTPIGETITDGTKCGARGLILGEEIDCSAVTVNQRVRFAILCVMQVYRAPIWTKWAKAWLDKSDRSASGAYAAYAAADADADAAYAARAAADAASGAAGTSAAYAAYAAYAAADAADAIINFDALAKQAAEEEV